MSVMNEMMDEAQGKSSSSRYYAKQISIVQSSGSGKSRMVDQVAHHIFTIPIHLGDSDAVKGEDFHGTVACSLPSCT
jgi:nicotinamide riboside kinase